MAACNQSSGVASCCMWQLHQHHLQQLLPPSKGVTCLNHATTNRWQLHDGLMMQDQWSIMGQLQWCHKLWLSHHSKHSLQLGDGLWCGCMGKRKWHDWAVVAAWWTVFTCSKWYQQLPQPMGDGQQHWDSKCNNQMVAGAALLSDVRLQGNAWGLGWGGNWGRKLWQSSQQLHQLPEQAGNRGKWCGNGYNSSISMGNNWHTVTVMLLKYLEGDNQPAQIDWWQCSKWWQWWKYLPEKTFETEKHNHTMATDKVNSSSKMLSIVQWVTTKQSEFTDSTTLQSTSRSGEAAVSVMHSKPILTGHHAVTVPFQIHTRDHCSCNKCLQSAVIEI